VSLLALTVRERPYREQIGGLEQTPAVVEPKTNALLELFGDVGEAGGAEA
jgi:hypothetical protein